MILSLSVAPYEIRRSHIYHHSHGKEYFHFMFFVLFYWIFPFLFVMLGILFDFFYLFFIIFKSEFQFFYLSLNSFLSVPILLHHILSSLPLFYFFRHLMSFFLIYSHRTADCINMGMQYFPDVTSVPKHLDRKIRKSFFPPTAEEKSWMHLGDI